MYSVSMSFFREEDGQDMVEYSLLLAFIAMATIALLTGVGKSVTGLWTTVNTSLKNANTSATAGS